MAPDAGLCCALAESRGPNGRGLSSDAARPPGPSSFCCTEAIGTKPGTWLYACLHKRLHTCPYTGDDVQVRQEARQERRGQSAALFFYLHGKRRGAMPIRTYRPMELVEAFPTLPLHPATNPSAFMLRDKTRSALEQAPLGRPSKLCARQRVHLCINENMCSDMCMDMCIDICMDCAD